MVRESRTLGAGHGVCLLVFAIVAMHAVRPTVAECPNACNGHGNCGYFDICHCYRGWQAADCSQRTCAYGYAFTTTPQGDLNMDGDREDNSFKQLSEPGLIHINTNTLTFARSGLQLGEIKVGDGVRICNENFIVNEIRGRTIVGNDDFLDPTEHDDVTHVIDQETEQNHKRRIKELVLNGRHTQNCGTMPESANMRVLIFMDQLHPWDQRVTGIIFTKIEKGIAPRASMSVPAMFVNCGACQTFSEPTGRGSTSRPGETNTNAHGYFTLYIL